MYKQIHIIYKNINTIAVKELKMVRQHGRNETIETNT